MVKYILEFQIIIFSRVFRRREYFYIERFLFTNPPVVPLKCFSQLAVIQLTFCITYSVPGSMSGDLHALFCFILITTYEGATFFTLPLFKPANFQTALIWWPIIRMTCYLDSQSNVQYSLIFLFHPSQKIDLTTH